MAFDDHPSVYQTTPLPRNLRRIGLIAVLAAIAIAAFGILERRSHEAEVTQWTREQAIPTVAVITPMTGATSQRLVLPGTVQAWYQAPIYARVSGYLKKWYFDYGAHVKKGDVLAEIETPDLDAQLAASQARLNSAKALVKVREAERQFAQSTYERWRDSPKGVVSVQEQEAKHADYNSAAARLNAATAEAAAYQGEVDRLEALESFKKITAPFDGIVTARETDIGALINAGSGTGGGSGPELFRVADLHMMRIYVQVPQELSAGIKAGLSAELHLPQYPDKTFKAMVATTSSAINANARTLLVELQADNPKSELQPGAYAQVDFELPADSDVVRIPTSALVFRKHGMEVATIGPDQKITLKPIELGRNLGVEVEVLKGLTISDRLVNSPPDSLATGDSVRITGEFARATGGAQTSDATAQETTSSRADSKVHRGEQISEPTDQVKKSPATGFAKEPAGKSGVSGPPVATLATVPL
jgi:RND family efflux transporter MFP subunit